MANHCDPSYTYAVATAQEEGQGEEKTALTIPKLLRRAIDVAFLFYFATLQGKSLLFQYRHLNYLV